VQSKYHPPQEQKTRFRIAPGFKVFRENIAMLLCIFDLTGIVCVFKYINRLIGPFLNVTATLLIETLSGYTTYTYVHMYIHMYINSSNLWSR
jgi:hypothetical protein